MTQVVVQDFELQGVPQANPGAAEHAIDKLPPQWTKGGFALLADLTEDKAVSWSLIAGNEQQVGFFRQFGCALVTPIAQITAGYSPSHSLDQSQCHGPGVPIAGRQEDIKHPPLHVTQ